MPTLACLVASLVHYFHGQLPEAGYWLGAGLTIHIVLNWPKYR